MTEKGGFLPEIFKSKPAKRLYVTTARDSADPEYTQLQLTFGKSKPSVVWMHQQDFAEFVEGLRHGFAEIHIRPTH